MNEQRTQAYINLINQLLTCNNGDEPRILQENQELLDRGLVEVMVSVAQQYGEAGRENEAQWLMNMAQQLAQALGLLDSEPSSISTETFDEMPRTVYVLLYNAGTDIEGIHTISNQERHTILIFESSADASNFIQKLEENNFPVPTVEEIELEEVLSSCQQMNYNWEFVPEGANRFPPDGSAETPRNNDETREPANTSQEYLNFLLETLRKIEESPNPQLIYPFWVQNLDKIDAYFAITLEILAKKTLMQAPPEEAYSIAGIIVNLSNLIAQFPQGNILANKEIAITGYQLALTIFTFETFPQDWALIQNNLALTYSDRIQGDKEENLERAIAAYTEALKVRTFDTCPQEWATTQYNLALTYNKRIQGDKGENLDRAIFACTEALKVFTFEAFPKEWAATQHTLATAYNDL